VILADPPQNLINEGCSDREVAEDPEGGKRKQKYCNIMGEA
jgi:hypothetical protein